MCRLGLWGLHLQAGQRLPQALILGTGQGAHLLFYCGQYRDEGVTDAVADFTLQGGAFLPLVFHTGNSLPHFVGHPLYEPGHGLFAQIGKVRLLRSYLVSHFVQTFENRSHGALFQAVHGAVQMGDDAVYGLGEGGGVAACAGNAVNGGDFDVLFQQLAKVGQFDLLPLMMAPQAPGEHDPGENADQKGKELK